MVNLGTRWARSPLPSGRHVVAQCHSCGHVQLGYYCERCGAALEGGIDVVDDGDVLSLMMGLVCGACDSYNDPGASLCSTCGLTLVESTTPAQVTAPHVEPAVPMPLSFIDEDSLSVATASFTDIERESPSPASSPSLPTSARCPSCQQPTEPEDRFCRHCGARVPAQVQLPSMDAKAPATQPAMTVLSHPAAPVAVAAPSPTVAPGATLFLPRAGGLAPPSPTATMFFGAASAERYARLLLVRGSTDFGTQWRLQASQTVIGRNHGAVIFPDDDSLADKHCTLEFRGDELWLVPEPSRNGVFLQLRSRTVITDGAEFVCGSQRFGMLRSDARETLLRTTEEGTTLCGSPLPSTSLHVRRMAARPHHEERYLRAQRVLTIGRSGCDLNYASDGFLSTRHAQVGRDDDDTLFLEDLGSRNGTFVRVYAPYRLHHGDTLLLGAQVMRVELSLGLPR